MIPLLETFGLIGLWRQAKNANFLMKCLCGDKKFLIETQMTEVNLIFARYKK